MYNAEFGFVNGFIRMLGGEGRTIWLGESTRALHAIIVAEVWRGLPLTTLFLLAGLQTLPDQVYEAAETDGAGLWRAFRDMTVPLMLPVLLPVMLFQFVWALKAFDIIFVLTRGGPGNDTMTLNYLVYQQAFQQFNFGQASATAYALTLITIASIALVSLLRWRTVATSGMAPA
jgi:multiple sugar transport system permease protein